jgi:hypothetical protein
MENGRVYRVVDFLGNGTVILDAEDSLPHHRRLTVDRADLPEGTNAGAVFRCEANGQLALAEPVIAFSGRIDLPDAIEVESPNLFGAVIRAAIMTLSDRFGLPERLAAHLAVLWIRVEFRL